MTRRTRSAAACRAAARAAALVLLLPVALLAAPDDDYDLAVGLYKKARWELAAETFRGFLRETPNHERAPYARLYLGLALVNAGDHAAARDVLRDFARRHPQHPNLPDALYRVGESSYFLNDFKASAAELTEFLRRHPDHELAEWALPYLGDAQLRLGKPSEAATAFRRTIEKYPKGRLADEAKFGLARAAEELDKPDDATALYRELAAGGGSRAAAAQLRIATRLYDAGDHAAAADAFRTLSERFPESPLVASARLNAGFALYRTGDFAGAAAELERAAETPAQAATATHWLGMARKAAGDYPAAARAFKAVVDGHGDQSVAGESLFHWADAALRAKQYDEAARLFARFADRDPKAPRAAEALHFAGESALLAGDLAAAEGFVERFRRDHAKSPFRMHDRLLGGRILEAKADAADLPAERRDALQRQALAEFEAVLKDSDLPETRDQARYRLARLREARGEHAEALAAVGPLLDDVAKRGKEAAYLDAALIAARSRLARGEEDKAVEAATEYLDAAPQGDRADAALAVRAAAHVAAGRAADATADWKTLRESFPKSGLIAATARDLAERAYDREDWATAAEFFTALTAVAAGTPDEAAGLAGLGWTRSKSGDFAAAAESFGTLVDRFPALPRLAPEAAYMQGKSLQDAGDLAAAADAYAAAFAAYAPAEPAAAGDEADGPLRNAYLAGLQRARVLRLQEKTAEADAAYAALAEKFPKPRNLDALLDEWALLHYEAGDYAKADALFRRLVAEAPESAYADDARLSLAESALFAGKLDAAAADLRVIVDDARTDPKVRSRAASLLVSLAAERADWKAAESLATSFLSRFPEAPERPVVLYQFGEAQLQLGKTDAAAATLAEAESLGRAPAVRAEPWFPRVYVLLAEAAFRKKDYAAVEKHAATVKGFDPPPEYAYLADEVLGRSLKNRRRFDEARAAFERVLADERSSRTETAARAQYEIAQTYFLQERWAEAQTAAFKVYTLYAFPQWQAPALYMAGVSDEALGRRDQAAAAYADVIEEFPDTEYAGLAKEKLAKLGKGG